LGITNNTVNATVDQIHASLQIQDAPLQGFGDALNATGIFQWAGGVHYPRGITTSLWWLTPTNNPGDPAPNITASVNASTVTISWPQSYVGWILQTNTLRLGSSAGWGGVPGSSTMKQMSFPLNDPAIPVEYFRLRHP